MILRALPVAFAAFLASCATTPPSIDAEFERYAARAIDEMWEEFPELAVRYGNYKYASRLSVPDEAGRARDIAFYDRQLAALARFDPAALNVSNRVDHGLMKNRFAGRRWYLTTFREWQWSPASYNVGQAFGPQLVREYAPAERRFQDVIAKLENVPAYYAAAKASIKDPTLEHTTLAILRNRGALRVFGEDLDKRVNGSNLSPTEKDLYSRRVAAARVSINDYISWLTDLEGRLKAGGARSFRIGKTLYEQKFAYDIQSSYTVDQLHARAMAEKAALHDAMEKRARELWPKWMAGNPMPADRLVMIRAVLDEMSKRHTTREAFVDTIRKQIPSLEAFVREKDLVDQDPTKPLKVRETPAYMRGSGAGASISSPGPYDVAGDTWYNVDPLDNLTPEQAESFLREYNDWTLQILNIHEAIPGHYMQLVHANKSPSLVKSLFGNGAMIEGWAVFSEKVMLDAGYDNGSPEIWISWMKWNLRSVVNTILDIEIQTRGMTREQAMDMMVREAFQQDREATEKWLRATLSQVQLTSYFNGYSEITALRDELRAKQGAAFSVKGFNNRFLSYGSAPVKDIAVLMGK